VRSYEFIHAIIIIIIIIITPPTTTTTNMTIQYTVGFWHGDLLWATAEVVVTFIYIYTHTHTHTHTNVTGYNYIMSS